MEQLAWKKKRMRQAVKVTKNIKIITENSKGEEGTVPGWVAVKTQSWFWVCKHQTLFLAAAQLSRLWSLAAQSPLQGCAVFVEDIVLEAVPES